MGNVREYAKSKQARAKTPAEHLALLRHFHFSVHPAEREEALALVVETGGADAARELVTVYRLDPERGMRVRIVEALRHFPDARTVEFLTTIAPDVSDLGLAEMALHSLAFTKGAFAELFLERFLEAGPPPLRPAAVTALSESGSPAAARVLAQAFRTIDPSKDPRLARTLADAMGVLRVRSASEALLDATRRTEPAGYADHALRALARVTRDEANFRGACEGLAPDSELRTWTRETFQSRLRWSAKEFAEKFAAHRERDAALELGTYSDEELRKLLGTNPAQAAEFLCEAGESTADSLLHGLPEDALPRDTWIYLALRRRSTRFAEVAERFCLAGLDDADAFENSLDAVVAAAVDPPKLFERLGETATFAKLSADAQIRLANSLVRCALYRSDEKGRKRLVTILRHGLEHAENAAVRARYLRAFAQLRRADEVATKIARDKQTDLASALFYFLRVPAAVSSGELLALLPQTSSSLDLFRALLRALCSRSPGLASEAGYDRCIAKGLAGDADTRAETLRLVARHPIAGASSSVHAALGGSDERIQFLALDAIGALQEPEAVADLQRFLRSENPSLAGRSLARLLAISSIEAKEAALRLVEERQDDEDLIGVVLANSDPAQMPQTTTRRVLEGILSSRPKHASRETIARFLERLPEDRAVTEASRTSFDDAITQRYAGFPSLHVGVCAALRAAEIPLRERALYEGAIDKAGSILEYCKAADLYLERYVGRAMLFPRLESQLYEFQNQVSAVGLDTEAPDARRICLALGIEQEFGPHDFPTQKMATIARTVLDGRIVRSRFQPIDGLRAWASVFLLFALPVAGGGRPPLGDRVARATVLAVARRLMKLQDIRNPAAHREPILTFEEAEAVRDETYSLFAELDSIVGRAV